MKNNPYTILEISDNTSQLDIRRAFQRMALKYHPDRNKNGESKRKFIEIVEAYEALCDNKERVNNDNGGHNTYSDEYYNMLLYLVIAVLQYIIVQLSQTTDQQQ